MTILARFFVPRAALPARVKRAILAEQDRSEKLIGWFQMGLVGFFAALYAVSPAPADRVFDPLARVGLTLGGLAMASIYAVALLLTIGIVLVVFVMVLSLRERVSEIGTLKAIGASNGEIVGQFMAEAATLCGLGGIGAVIVAVAGAELLRATLALPVAPDTRLLLSIAGGAVLFAIVGSLYPIVRARQLSPVEAMRSAE